MKLTKKQIEFFMLTKEVFKLKFIKNEDGLYNIYKEKLFIGYTERNEKLDCVEIVLYDKMVYNVLSDDLKEILWLYSDNTETELLQIPTSIKLRNLN